ncbi:MAG TPA: hemolysin III family protein, partial [Prevotella sp.]
AFKPLVHNLPTEAFVWLLAEGAAYITGAVFYSLNKRRFMHTVFHFFVLLGSICHLVAVWSILMKWL